MIQLKQNLIGLGLLLLAVFAGACDDDKLELERGKDYILSSQADVNAFKVTQDIRTLTIEGEDITDLSALQFQNAKSLIIRNTGITELALPRLSAITIGLTISENENLKAIDGLEQFKFMNGSLIIEDNPALESIAGLLHLKIFRGSLTISDNMIFGEDKAGAPDSYGLMPVKYLLDNSIMEGTITLANNHPKAATDPSRIGQMGAGDILSYVIGSRADADKFMPANETVMNLTVRGSDINDAVLAGIASKIKVIQGKMLLENTGTTTTEGFFDKVDCQGSIVLKDNPALMNCNGFKGYTVIGGDLVIENCPEMTFWSGAGFSFITEVKGNFKVDPASTMTEGGAGFVGLSRVGGNFELNGDKANNKGDLWNCDTWLARGGGLKYVGGDFILKNHLKINGLGGFQNIQYIGGDVTIVNNGGGEGVGDIPSNSTSNQVGYCLIKGFLDFGIVKPTAVITLVNASGEVIDVNSLTACGISFSDYELNGLEEVNNFTPSSQIIGNLTIRGADVTDHAVSFIKTKITTVMGTVTIENTALTTTENFFESIDCRGGIVLRNNPELFNCNGFKGYTEIGGDLIIENCPKMAYWADMSNGAGFCKIARVEGNFKVDPATALNDGGIGFASLSWVGGDFELNGDPSAGEIWNWDSWMVTGGGLKHVGGNFTVKNHYKVNGLGGFQSIEYIGGDVTIMDNGGPDGFIPLQNTDNQIGFCLIKDFLDNGVLKKPQPTILLRQSAESEWIDVNSLQSCN
ncbi:hypothetical protein [Culturomica sp.]|uniref:hypothetical protein n=1 Tax=Culturomica sp. TaxID=1926652 RepID=UPI000E8E661D|nr:hypothetical protein [Culturomica sp.]HBO25306.1 hypothetical protein [Culturomica sp.]